MIEQKFKIGDCVVLKIGGPKMSVSEVETKPVTTNKVLEYKSIFTGYYTCKWFEDNNLKEGRFHQDELVLS